MEKEYAQAIATMSRETGRDQAALAGGLIAHLRRTGRSKMLPGILRELLRAKEREAKLASVLEVASEAETAAAQAFLAKEGVEVKTVHVNPSLIRGWRARANGLLWDQSAKRALTDIYKKITN